MTVEPGKGTSAGNGGTPHVQKLQELQARSNIDFSPFLALDLMELQSPVAWQPSSSLDPTQKKALQKLLDEKLPPDNAEKRRAVAELLGFPQGQMNQAQWNGVKLQVLKLIDQVRANAFKKIKFVTRPEHTRSQASLERDEIRAKSLPIEQLFTKPGHEQVNFREALRTRIIALLTGAGILSLGDLTEHREADLFKIPGIGRKMIAEIKTGLSRYGLELKP